MFGVKHVIAKVKEVDQKWMIVPVISVILNYVVQFIIVDLLRKWLKYYVVFVFIVLDYF